MMSGSLTVVRHDTWNNNAKIYIGPPPPGREVIMIENRRGLRIKNAGSMVVVFHEYTDERTTLLVDASHGSGLCFNLSFSWQI